MAARGTVNLSQVGRRSKKRPRNSEAGICPRCERGARRNQERCTLCDGDGWVWVSKD